MTTIDIDDILKTLKEEKQILVESRATLYGKEYMIDKLIQYYTELKNQEGEVSKI